MQDPPRKCFAAKGKGALYVTPRVHNPPVGLCTLGYTHVPNSIGIQNSDGILKVYCISQERHEAAESRIETAKVLAPVAQTVQCGVRRSLVCLG